MPIEWHPRETGTVTQLLNFNLHYLEYVESLPDELFSAVVSDWIDHNPPYQPWYWRDSWSSYALSLRCVVLMQQIAVRSSRLSAAFRARVAHSVFSQITFLTGNLEKDIGGNHLVKNIKALLWAGAFFEGPVAARWTDLGVRLLRSTLAEQILADGMHFERSPAYHAQVFADVLECFAVLDRDTDGAAWLAPLLARMASALAEVTHPDGMVSLFNDGGLHMTYAPAQLLATHASQLPSDAARQPPATALREAGYFGIRDASALVLVDCGPIGPDHLPAHGHGDVLAFEWSVNGARFVVDAGVHEYIAGSRRRLSRGTCAHNTVTLDDQDQAEFWSSFRVGRRPRVAVDRFGVADGVLSLVGHHDGYRWMAGAPVHERAFNATPRRIEVVDRVIGGAGQTVASRILLHPSCRVTHDVGSLLIVQGETVVRLSSDSHYSVEQRPWWPDFGVEMSTHQVILHYGQAPCSGGFLLDVLDVPVDAEAQEPPIASSRGGRASGALADDVG